MHAFQLRQPKPEIMLRIDGFSPSIKFAPLLTFACSKAEQSPKKTTSDTKIHPGNDPMAKPTHKVKKANHGKRPANNRGRKAKKKRIKTP
jgi:hypothetical protein